MKLIQVECNLLNSKYLFMSIADMIQGTLDGFISARNDNEKTERKKSKNANK